MTPRALKLALAASVAVNLFAVGAFGVVLTQGPRLAREEAPPPARVPMLQIVDAMPEAKRDAMRQALRATALAARPDFHAARQARRDAVALASEMTFDRAAVAEALARSNAAEMRGRERLEAGALDMLERLPMAQRAALAPILTKTGVRHRRHRQDRDRGNGAVEKKRPAPAESAREGVSPP